jgi:hypothetical protein
MGSALHNEKLDSRNLGSWEYKKHDTMLDKANGDVSKECTKADYSVWEQGSSGVMCCLIAGVLVTCLATLGM